MSQLNSTAKATLRDAGVTQVGWAREFWLDGIWGGDACGCPDDRCIGHHHEAYDECRCLPALLADKSQ